MTDSPAIIRVDPNDPRTLSYLQSEQRLLAHFGILGTTRYVKLTEPDIQVRVLEIGTGAPVLVVPGGNGESFPWIALLAELKEFRFLLLDRPGGGLSDFADPLRFDFRRLAVSTLSAVLDAFALKSVSIICNSMGGLWSFWLTLDRPEYVGRMVQLGCPALLLNSSAPAPMRLSSLPFISRRMVALTVPKQVSDGLSGLRMMGSTPAQIARMPEEFGEASYYSRHLPTYETSWRKVQERVLTLAGPKRDLQLRERELASVKQPVLFIWGTHDPFGSIAVGKRAVNVMPNARLMTVNAGHLPFMDEPVECARLTREFLSGAAERS